MSKIVLVFEQQPIYLEGAWKINELPDECIVEYWTFLGWRDKTFNADYSKQKENIVSICSYEDLLENIKRISEDKSVVVFYPYHNYDDISFISRRLLKKYNIEFCNITEDAAMSQGKSFGGCKALFLGCKKVLQIFLYIIFMILTCKDRRIFKRLQLYIFRFWGPLKYKAKYNFVTSNRAFQFFPNTLEYFSSRNILLHTLDYDSFIHNNDERIFSQPYVVFIDQGLINMKWVNNSRKAKQIVNPDRYLNAMLDLFLQVEKDGYKIVIAAHPKSKYKDNFFGERPIVYGKTATLIRDSEFVIFHFSTCLSMIALYKKPFLQVGYAELLQNSSIRRAYQSTCKYFGTNYIDPEECQQLAEWHRYMFSAIDKYEKFLSEFVIADNSMKKKYRLIDAVVKIITSK